VGDEGDTIAPSSVRSRIRRSRYRRRLLRFAASAGGGLPRQRAPWQKRVLLLRLRLGLGLGQVRGHEDGGGTGRGIGEQERETVHGKLQ
jgi:hypothetical protein